MKFRLFLTLLISASSIVITKAQYVTIPDPNFVHVLQTSPYTASCMFFDKLDTTLAKNLNDSGNWADYWFSANISDITGLQYFKLMTTLNISDNNLASLPPLPTDLKLMRCFKNQLISLHDLPSKLQDLDCSHNQLSYVDKLPDSLHTFICNNNQLTSLPALPDTLGYLNCSFNQLTTLPSLPKKVGTLYCYVNTLTSLPTLPDSLTYLHCSDNNLTSLPVLPPKLNWVFCANNKLTFEDIVPLIYLTDFNYAPQDSVDNLVYVTSKIGDTLQVTTTATYTGNQYQWTKNGNNINDSATILGTNTPNLVLNHISLADSGVYSCIITNPSAPLLTLSRRTIHLKITKPPVIVEPLPELVIYELVSPNNDSDNDYFTILNIDKYKNIEVSISNSWGNVVFHNSHYQNDWNGNELSDGTYYYLIKAHDTNKSYKGRLIIKR